MNKDHNKIAADIMGYEVIPNKWGAWYVDKEGRNIMRVSSWLPVTDMNQLKMVIDFARAYGDIVTTASYYDFCTRVIGKDLTPTFYGVACKDDVGTSVIEAISQAMGLEACAEAKETEV